MTAKRFNTFFFSNGRLLQVQVEKEGKSEVVLVS